MHNHIKAHRLALRLSRLTLARLVGVDPLSIYRWETQRTTPALDDVARLAQALHTTPQALFPILNEAKEHASV